jgi:hypothetical protein
VPSPSVPAPVNGEKVEEEGWRTSPEKKGRPPYGEIYVPSFTKAFGGIGLALSALKAGLFLSDLKMLERI